MKLARISLLCAVLLTSLVACKSRPTPPDPSLTAMPGGGDAGLYVDPLLLNGAGAGTGLEGRAAGFEDGNRLEGVLPSVYFAFDQAAVRPGDRPALQQGADYLMQNPGTKLLIEGHCDWRGTTEYNMALGERRAASARDYLLSLGIDSARVEIVSMGDREASQTSDESALQNDRRADLIVILP